ASSTIRPASASTLTSPSVEEAVPPLLTSSSTRLSTPPQELSMSPATLCSLATPVGSTSDTTTVTPAVASARAVELPIPTGLPHPVIRATRAPLGMDPSPHFRTGHYEKRGTGRGQVSTWQGGTRRPVRDAHRIDKIRPHLSPRPAG